MDVATLRERVSSDRDSSTSSGGKGPLSVGMRPVRACSMLARLMFLGVMGLDVVGKFVGWLVFLARAYGTSPSRPHVDARLLLTSVMVTSSPVCVTSNLPLSPHHMLFLVLDEPVMWVPSLYVGCSRTMTRKRFWPLTSSSRAHAFTYY